MSGDFVEPDIGAGPSDQCPVCAVPNIAALSALNDLPLRDGCSVEVATVLQRFVLCKTSTDPIDGITVAPTASTVGRWERRGSPLPYWLAKTTWYVDPTTGDDENDGQTVGTALATIPEFFRRLDRGVVDHLVTCHVLADCPGQNIEPLCTTSGPSEYGIGQIHIQGQRTVRYQDVVAFGSHPWNPAANQRGTIKSAVAGIWILASAIGDFFVMINGANVGAVGCVAAIDPADATNSTAFYSPMFDPVTQTGGLNPAVGDAFSVYRVTKVGGYLATRGGPCYLTIQDLRIEYVSSSQPVLGTWSGTVLWPTLCQIVGTFAEQFSSTLELSACRVAVADLFFGHGATLFSDGNFYDHCGVSQSSGSTLVNYWPSVTFGDSAYAEPAWQQNAPCLGALFDWWGFFDLTAAVFAVFRGYLGGNVLDYGGAWGNGCAVAGAAMVMPAGGSWFYGAGVPAILGAAHDTAIGAAFFAYGALPHADANLNTRIVAI